MVLTINFAIFLLLLALNYKILLQKVLNLWRILLAIFIFGVILKVLLPLGETGGLSWEYIENAFDILKNRPLQSLLHVQGTSVIHATTIYLFGFNYPLIELLFVIFQASSLVLIFLITSEITKDIKASLVASFIYLFLPANLYLSKSLLSEHYAAFFLLVSFYSFLLFLKENRSSLFFLAIASFTLTAGIRVEMILSALPLAFLFLSTKAWKKLSWKELFIGCFMLAFFAFNFIGWILYPINLDVPVPKELENVPLSMITLRFIPYQINRNMWVFEPIIHPPALFVLFFLYPLFYRRNKNMFWFLSLWFLCFLVFYLNYPGILFTYVPLIYIPLSICCAISFYELIYYTKNIIGRKNTELIVAAILLLSLMPGFIGIIDGSFEMETRTLHCTFSMDARNTQRILEKKCILIEPLKDVTDLGDTPKKAIVMFFSDYGVFSDVEKIKDECGDEFYYLELKRFTNKKVEERINKNKIEGNLKEVVYSGCTFDIWLVRT